MNTILRVLVDTRVRGWALNRAIQDAEDRPIKDARPDSYRLTLQYDSTGRRIPYPMVGPIAVKVQADEDQ